MYDWPKDASLEEIIELPEKDTGLLLKSAKHNKEYINDMFKREYTLSQLKDFFNNMILSLPSKMYSIDDFESYSQFQNNGRSGKKKFYADRDAALREIGLSKESAAERVDKYFSSDRNRLEYEKEIKILSTLLIPAQDQARRVKSKERIKELEAMKKECEIEISGIYADFFPYYLSMRNKGYSHNSIVI